MTHLDGGSRPRGNLARLLSHTHAPRWALLTSDFVLLPLWKFLRRDLRLRWGGGGVVRPFVQPAVRGALATQAALYSRCSASLALTSHRLGGVCSPTHARARLPSATLYRNNTIEKLNHIYYQLWTDSCNSRELFDTFGPGYFPLLFERAHPHTPVSNLSLRGTFLVHREGESLILIHDCRRECM